MSAPCPYCGFTGPYLSEPEAWREIGAVFERLADRGDRCSHTGLGSEVHRLLAPPARINSVVLSRMLARIGAHWQTPDAISFDTYDWPSRALACYLLALEAEDASNVATLHPDREG